jgi:hypothetical protein
VREHAARLLKWLTKETGMNEPVRGSREEMWRHQFGEVDREIAKMASLCGVDLRDRTQVRRVLERDAGVCTRDNPLAFDKLTTLLKAHYLLRDRAADQIGDAAAQAAIDDVVAELVRKFNAATGREDA